SSGATRYCRPPVLMTANIVFVLRVFGPGLGHIARAGFLFSRYGFRRMSYVFRALPKREFAQKQAAREPPRRMAGLIAANSPKTRKTGKKARQKKGIWPQNGTCRRHGLCRRSAGETIGFRAC